MTPGGHVELGEEIEEAVLREAKEEVGIDIKSTKSGECFYEDNEVKLEPLILYESTFGIKESLFLRQSIIFYYSVKLPVSYKDISIKVQPNEVDNYAWISYLAMKNVLDHREGSFQVATYLLQKDRSISEEKIPLKRLFGPYPNEWKEGMAVGHLKALEVFIK